MGRRSQLVPHVAATGATGGGLHAAVAVTWVLQHADVPAALVAQYVSSYAPGRSGTSCVDGDDAGAGWAVEPPGFCVTDHEDVSAPPPGSEACATSGTPSPTVVVAPTGHVTKGGAVGQTPPSSTEPSQSSSRPLHTSVAGPIAPLQAP